jgi:hypothetical protein
MRCEVTLHVGNHTDTISDIELDRYADEIGLNAIAKDRCSWAFLMDLLLHERYLGVEAWAIVEEIRALEQGKCGVGTKPASQFQHKPLRGFWHKHYFCARFTAQNILNQLAGGRLETIVNDTLSANLAAIVPDQMWNHLAHTATVQQIEEREDAGRLTGEWIIFAKHHAQNYYLCLAAHDSGDQAIFEKVKSTCFPQFPFLSGLSELEA